MSRMTRPFREAVTSSTCFQLLLLQATRAPYKALATPGATGLAMADVQVVTPVSSPQQAADGPALPKTVDQTACELFSDEFDSMNIGKEDDEGSEVEEEYDGEFDEGEEQGDADVVSDVGASDTDDGHVAYVGYQ